MSYDDSDYLMLSGIQHFEFCRRQWALIHIEQQWADNYTTTSGELMHKRAHDESSVEKRGELLIMRGLRVSSCELGLSGQCDVVEFRQDSGGINIFNYNGKWNVTPVEYKRGTDKEGREDDVQICAQAICLEEMFMTDIPEGYLFYGKNKRRVAVTFDEELREHTKTICKEMHALYQNGYTPKVKSSKKCVACSLKDICIPKLNKTIDVETYIAKTLNNTGEKK